MTVTGPEPQSAKQSERIVVLLHGWGASQQIWRLVERAPLTARYRLIALDLPGTGSTPALPDASMHELADWVAAELDRRGIDRCAVLGHSMGANVAAHFAQRHPARIVALILVAAALQSDRLRAATFYLHPLVGTAVLSGARIAAGVAGWLESRLPERGDPGWTRGYMRRSGYLMSDNTVAALQSQLRGLLSTPANLRSVAPDIPVLIMHGGRDSTVPVAWAHEAAQSRPDGTSIVVYPDALHCPMDTHTDKFCRDVCAFLDGAPWPNRSTPCPR